MKHLRDISPADIELYNRSRNDVICFASREVAIFILFVSLICSIPDVLQWVCISVGVLLAIFSMVWDSLITLGKVKAVQGKFLWLFFSIQGIAVTLLLLMKSKASLIIVTVLVFQVAALLLASIMGQRHD